jgi:phosphoglycolate phosphatase-like HAD superfamily hydrolase
MARVTGKAATTPAEEARYLSEARDAYAVLFLEIVADGGVELLNEELIEKMVEMKRGGKRVALISTSPDIIVTPALAILGLGDLFDEIFASPRENAMRKEVLLRLFQRTHGLIERYLGDSVEDAAACAALGILFIAAGERTAAPSGRAPHAHREARPR